MGQRTQILVVRENNKGEKKTKFYHHQWGFGRVMYLALMDAFMNDYNKETFIDDYNFLDNKNFTTFNTKMFDITCYVPEDVLNAADVNDINTIKKVFDYGDNDNGGLVISIKEGNDHHSSADFKIGFLLGWEECQGWADDGKYYKIEEPFSRYVTPQEYGQKNGGCNYSDEAFVKIFTDFCNYFGIEYFENKN